MKTTLLLGVLSFLVLACTAQTTKQNKDNDLARAYLRGSVKTITNDGKSPSVETFNPAGFLIETSSPEGKEVMVLDENNRIITINGKPLKDMIYDSKNHLIQKGKDTPDKNDMCFFSKYEYNSDGMLISSKFANGYEMWNMDFSYNDKGYRIKDMYMGEVSSERTYKDFNKQGDPTQIVTIEEEEMGADPVTTVTTIAYEYDQQDNWTKKTETTNGKSTTVNRKITYHN